MTARKKTLICIRCGEEFTPRHPDDTLCADCAKLVAQSQESPQGVQTQVVPGVMTQDILAGVMTAVEPGIMTQLPDKDGDTSSPLISALASDQPQVAEAEVPAIWKVGDVILDLYEVKNIFESGGMGLVYQVYHRNWKVDLVAKSPRPDFFKTDAQRENFIAEADTWIKLGLHPHIVSCYYVRTLGGIPRLFAEYVGGGNLHDWVKDRRLYEGGPDTALARMLDVAIQFAWGLDYAHAQGLVHQDVKPGNVMMTPEGIAQVTDFGLAKVRAAGEDVSPADPSISALVSFGGYTPAYCSPEQARHESLSPKTDLWSWGVSILEMFVGDITWKTGLAAEAVLESYLQQGFEDFAIPPMPIELADLLRRCFREDPGERPNDMAEIANELKRIFEQATGAPYPRPESKPAEALADSLNNRAASMLDIGKPDEADRLWAEALAADPQHLDTTYNWGVQRWRRGEMSDNVLVQEMDAARTTNPERWEGSYLLGLVHLERADLEAALPLLEAAAEQAPEEGEAQDALALAHSGEIKSIRCLNILEGHADWVWTVALSADGQLALSGSGDNTLRLWKTIGGECQRILKGHSDKVTSVALSSDGRIALSGGWDGTLRQWNPDSGHCLRTLEAQAGQVISVTMSVDGNLALSWSQGHTASPDKSLRVWDLDSGRCLRVLEGHAERVNSATLSADGRLALSGSNDQTLRLWDVTSGECLRVLEIQTGVVTAVALSANGRLALSGGADVPLQLWDLDTGYCLHILEGHTGYVSSLALSVDGSMALSGSSDNSVRVWELSSGRCLRVLEGHTETVDSVALSADGRLALSGSHDGTLRLWELPGRWPLGRSSRLARRWSYADISQAGTQVEALLAGSRAASATGDFAVALDLARQARGVAGYERAPGCLDTWAGLYAVSAKIGLRTAWPTRVLEENRHKVHFVAQSADGRLALSSQAFDNTVRVWELSSGRCLRVLKGHTGNGFVNSVALSADGRLALSGSFDKTVRLWDIESGRCLHVLEGHTDWVGPVALSTDARYALSGGGGDHSVRLWDLATGGCLRILKGHTHVVNSLTLNADGRLALSGSYDETLRLWDSTTGECVRVLEGHKHDVTSVVMSADNRWALSGGADQTLRFWNLASGDCLRVLEGHKGTVRSVAMSADGRWALSGSNDKTLWLWEMDWEMEAHDIADWDDDALPYLANFLTLHTPLAGTLPEGRDPSEEEIRLTLTRRGKPTWTEEDFQGMLTSLGYAGYGWLRPDGVRRQLEAMARDWQGPPPLRFNRQPS